MKVFYVVVLVLVAGAVPSHGRTESEGTVFNKTQLHEIMSNETVSSSKFETYDFSYMVMQWPRSYCSRRHCNQLVDRFTVHGLWPQRYRGGGINCRRIHRRYPRFNISLPNFGGFLHYLNYYWPNLDRVASYNYIFWGSEYNKHGSCTFNNQSRYFELALELAWHLENPISRLTGIGGIVFGHLYSSYDIKVAVHSVTTKWPRLNCVLLSNGSSLLLEILFCVDQNRLTNCGRYTDCENRMVYLPPP